MILQLNEFLFETRPGEKFNRDLNKLLQGSKLQTTINSERVDISSIVSPVLNDMFVVLELECYYPIKENRTIFTHEVDSSTPYTASLFGLYFKQDFDLYYGIYKTKRSYVDELLKQNKDVYKQLSKTKTFKELIELESKIKDFSDLNKAKDKLAKLLDSKSVGTVLTDTLRNQLNFKVYDLFCRENFDGNSNPSILEFATKFNLELLYFYEWNSDKTALLNKIQTVESEEECFNYIANDLEQQFKGSLFEGSGTKVLLEPKEGSTRDKTKWYVTSDESLPEIRRNKGFENYKAVELLTRAISFDQLEPALEFINKLFAKISVITTDNCSMHANIGFKTDRRLDLLKVTILTDDKKELQIYNRSDNRFARSQLVSIKEDSKINSVTLKDIQKEISTFENIDFSKYLKTDEKYRSLNFIKWLTTKEGYEPVLEFRIIGGKNYIPGKKIEILNSLRRYFGIVSISGDSELYKKEYLRKLFQISQETNEINKSSDDKVKFAEYLSKLKDLISKDGFSTEKSSRDIALFKFYINRILEESSTPLIFSEYRPMIPIIKEIYKKPELVEILSTIKDSIENTTLLKKFNGLFFNNKLEV